MADSTDYEFYVEADTNRPFGPVTKENIDITRLIFDFTCWLEDEDGGPGEPIGSVGYPAIIVESEIPYPPWRVDYPLDCPTVTTVTDDTYPLTVMSVAISGGGTEVEVRLSAGTPGLTYVVSVVVNSGNTKRRKQVDALVSVEIPLNAALVGPAPPDVDDDTVPLIVGGNTVLPPGFDGRIYVENGSSAPITITLPPLPYQGQRVAPVDIYGNAATYNIIYAGAASDKIYGSPTFVSDINYDDLIFEWVGDHWIILASRYAFLG